MTSKTVVITGSNRGIGLAFAQLYVSQGWRVIAAARSPESATEVSFSRQNPRCGSLRNSP